MTQDETAPDWAMEQVQSLHRHYWTTFRDLAIRTPDTAMLLFGATREEIERLVALTSEEFVSLMDLPGPIFQPRFRLAEALRAGARARSLLSTTGDNLW